MRPKKDTVFFSVRIPTLMRDDLERLAKEKNTTVPDLGREILRKYLYEDTAYDKVLNALTAIAEQNMLNSQKVAGELSKTSNNLKKAFGASMTTLQNLPGMKEIVAAPDGKKGERWKQEYAGLMQAILKED